jgi:hypothetical protein
VLGYFIAEGTKTHFQSHLLGLIGKMTTFVNNATYLLLGREQKGDSCEFKRRQVFCLWRQLVLPRIQSVSIEVKRAAGRLASRKLAPRCGRMVPSGYWAQIPAVAVTRGA